MSTAELYRQIEQLSPQEQLVLAKQILTGLVQQIPAGGALFAETETPETTTRVAGLHAGMAWVSNDFDEPLPDEFWLGQA